MPSGRTRVYLNTVAHDSLSAFEEGLLPGERQFLPEGVAALHDGFNDPAKLAGGQKAIEVADLLLARVQLSLGGYTAAGSSPIEGDNRLVDGTYAFVGPEAFFVPDKAARRAPCACAKGRAARSPSCYPDGNRRRLMRFSKGGWGRSSPTPPPARRCV